MKRFGNRLKRVISTNDESFIVRLKFEDGATVSISLAHIFDTPRALAAEVVRGHLFAKCFVESGALAWPNGLELCGDALRGWAQEQARRKAA